jgi:hypothetical protein
MRRPPLALALFLLATATSVARAQVPDVPNITLPPGVPLVGERGGVTDPAGVFKIIVRDIAMNPVPGASVVIAFDECGDDLRICATPGMPGVTVDCDVPRVRAVTDLTGTATFAIRGGGRNIDPASIGMCARVLVEDAPVARLRVAAFDLTGAGGVGPPDISSWIADYFRSATTLMYFSRSDYDFNGTLSPADLSILLRVSLGGTSNTSCSKFCN